MLGYYEAIQAQAVHIASLPPLLRPYATEFLVYITQHDGKYADLNDLVGALYINGDQVSHEPSGVDYDKAIIAPEILALTGEVELPE